MAAVELGVGSVMTIAIAIVVVVVVVVVAVLLPVRMVTILPLSLSR